jgi:hypothetical protein
MRALGAKGSNAHEEAPDLIRRAYQAFNARDLDTALAALHPKVDWPNAIGGGRVRGRNAIRRYWTRQFEVSDPRVEPLSISEEDECRVVVDVHQVVRDPDGTVLIDERVQHIHTFSDGLIARMDIRQLGLNQ